MSSSKQHPALLATERMWKMKKAVTVLFCALAILLFLPAAPAGASPAPLSLHFDVDTTIPEDVTQATYGPFTATGPAVDAGLICPSGDTIDVVYWASGFHAIQGINFHLVKRFTCTDGSGGFLVKLEVRYDRKGGNFNWMILEGTGQYENLHGAGQGMAIDGTPSYVHDVYDGFAIDK